MSNLYPFGGRSITAWNQRTEPINMERNTEVVGGRGYGKSAAQYTQIIESGQYPSSVGLSQQNELSKLWNEGKRMDAIKKLQDILEPARGGKTLL